MAVPLRDDLRTQRFPWVTLALIVANVVIFLFVQPSAYQNPPAGFLTRAEAERQSDAVDFSYRWGAIGCEVLAGEPLAQEPDGCTDSFAARSAAASADLDGAKSPYLSLLTSMFLHGSIAHLAGNMLFLWVFGNNVEDRLGRGLYLALYLVGGVLATLGFVAVNRHSMVPLVGASGAIAVAMGAYLVLHPRSHVLAVVAPATFQLVYVPAAIVLVLFFVTQFFTVEEQVAWEAHAAGMAVGVAAALGLRLLPSVRRRSGTVPGEPPAGPTGSAF